MADEAAEAEKAELESKRVEMWEKVKKVGESLKQIGFRTPDRYSTNDKYSTATMVVIGPNEIPYTLTVYQGGGYSVEKI